LNIDLNVRVDRLTATTLKVGIRATLMIADGRSPVDAHELWLSFSSRCFATLAVAQVCNVSER
jgi:hypothetical protein